MSYRLANLIDLLWSCQVRSDWTHWDFRVRVFYARDRHTKQIEEKKFLSGGKNNFGSFVHTQHTLFSA
jgi:hypothetical protein